MRRTTLSVLAAASLIGALTVSPGEPAAASLAGYPAYHFCPGPEPLIGARTRWVQHRLAPGVSLSETTVHDRQGRLDVRVVRADLDRPSVEIGSLHRSLASRHRLTAMARRRHLVAAVNGMYFNSTYGAPVVPFITGRRPLVLSVRHESVAGIGVDGRAQSGDVWLVGNVNSDGRPAELVAVNDVDPPRGLSLYTAAWGSHRVPLPPNARSRAMRHGRVLRWSHPRRVPRHGRLLVARGTSAVSWLRAQDQGRRVAVSIRIATNADTAFRQAYGVGTRVVATAGQVEHDLYCDRLEIRAARTTIGWRRDGTRLILVTVESRRGSEHYGLDENQMSEILVALGASRAYALDGGGSTELVTRRYGRGRLSTPTLNPRGGERPVPIGIGIYSR